MADRLDRAVLEAVLVDERDDQRRRWSSSPAKKAAASRPIAFASRSSRFSRSSVRVRVAMRPSRTGSSGSGPPRGDRAHEPDRALLRLVRNHLRHERHLPSRRERKRHQTGDDSGETYVATHHKVGVLRSYCNRERQTSDLCTLMDEALSSTPRLRSRTPGASSRPKKLSSSIVSKLVLDYSDGMAIHEIAKKYGVHRATISGHLDRAGVSRRPRSLSEAQIDEAVELYESGLSLEKIGNRLGFDSTTVLKELRLRGVRMRDTHGRQK